MNISAAAAADTDCLLLPPAVIQQVITRRAQRVSGSSDRMLPGRESAVIRALRYEATKGAEFRHSRTLAAMSTGCTFVNHFSRPAFW